MKRLTLRSSGQASLLSFLLVLVATAPSLALINDEISMPKIASPQPIASPTYAEIPTGDEVLVVYNTNYAEDENRNGIPDGYEIARYYQEARNIPEVNLVPITVSTAEEISRPEYDQTYDTEGTYGETSYIKQAIERYLTSHTNEQGMPLKDAICYIVLTKGIPLKIRQYDGLSRVRKADYSSVDAAVALLFQEYDIDGRIRNPYYNADPDLTLDYRFERFHFARSNGVALSYLVTRLDGYSIADIQGMIDRAQRAGTNREEYVWLLDDDRKTYDQMEEAVERLVDIGEKVFPDPWVDDKTWIEQAPGKVMGYVSHGIHADMPDGYVTEFLQFEYADGALSNTYESFNGYGFRSPDQSTHGQVAEFIRAGGTGGVGNVYEPYASSIAHEEIMLPAYAAGYPLADAVYMSLAYLDFATVVVGDPLTCIADVRVVHEKPAIPELVSFTAMDRAGRILLKWATSSEPSGLSFDVHRGFHEDDAGERITLSSIAGVGQSGGVYSYIDRTPSASGPCFYRLEGITPHGKVALGKPVCVQTDRDPWGSSLSASNHPNPFNAVTRIQFHLQEGGLVSLIVFDLLGRRVRTLIDDERSAGSWSVVWDGRNDAGRTVGSGTYLYQLKSEGQSFTKQMAYLK